jgi:hypothetical protein
MKFIPPLRPWLRGAKSILLSRYHLDNLADRPQPFDNRIDMIILDSIAKKFGAFAAVDNVSYTIQNGMLPLHPLLNLSIYILLIMTLMLACFNRKEI